MSGCALRFGPRILTSLPALLMSVMPISSLELWNADVPDLPDGVQDVSVYRTESDHDGAGMSDRQLAWRVERQSNDVVKQELYSRRGDYLWTTYFQYEDDTIRSIHAADGGTVRWTLRFEYDELGRPVRESYADSDEVPERTIVYEYGEEAVEVLSFRQDGSVAWRRIETAGVDQDTRETTYYYADGTRVKTIFAILDEQGRAVFERHLDELGSVYRTVEREYQNGEPTEEVVRDESRSIVRHNRWTYAPLGPMHERTIELPDEGLIERLRVSYTVNERGHWVTKSLITEVEYDGEVPFVAGREFLEREMEYE